MSVYTGRDATIKIGTTTLSDMTDYSFTIDAPLVEATVFGTSWCRIGGQGVKTATGSMSGLLNVADTDGQNVIESACISGTMINNFRLYPDATNYWTSDTATDAEAGCYFSNYSSAAAPNDMVSMSCDFKFHGPVIRTT